MANRNFNQLLSDWRAARDGLERLSRDSPRIIGSEAVKVVKDNFRLQGYDTGSGVQRWPSRKAVTNTAYDRNRSGKGKKKGAFKGSVYNSSNALLMQTKNLFNAIKYAVTGKSANISVNESMVPYAKKMNEGGSGKWGKKPTRTDARKFMPAPGEKPNPKILERCFKKIKSEREKIMKRFSR